MLLVVLHVGSEIVRAAICTKQRTNDSQTIRTRDERTYSIAVLVGRSVAWYLSSVRLKRAGVAC